MHRNTPIIVAVCSGALLFATGCGSEDPPFALPACYATDDCGGDGTDPTDDPTTQNGGDTCSLGVTWLAPNAVLLIDQSGSMNASFGTNGGISRWDSVYASLFDPMAGVAAQMTSSVGLGLSLYTGINDVECPALIDVAPKIDNLALLEQTFLENEPLSETPTGESIMAVADSLEAQAGPKHIILATDGVPDTCAQPNPNEGESVAIDGARYAFDKGITTHVIGIGLDVSASHLQDMANAGAGEPVTGNADYYQALEPSILTERFDSILSSLSSCSFMLDGPVQGEVSVMLDGQELAATDYQLVSPTEIALSDGTCGLYQNGAHEVTVSTPCAAPAGQ